MDGFQNATVCDRVCVKPIDVETLSYYLLWGLIADLDVYCLSFIFRSSSATGLGDWTISAGSTAAHTGRRWTFYHTAVRPTVIVVGVGTSFNVTTGTTSKAIEENTKPTIVATITD